MLKLPAWIKRPPWRTVAPAVLLLLLGAAAYGLWSPGEDFTDGRFDRGRNAIWIGHGWVADRSWFNRDVAFMKMYHDPRRMQAMTDMLRSHGMQDVFVHLSPASRAGRLPDVDHEQVEIFLDHCLGLRVLPWLGGAREVQVYPERPAWRQTFIKGIVTLLEAHPRFAGVHLNIEPCPSGSQDLLDLLDELRLALPAGKIISVAAYPPPTWLQANPEVHWDEAYFRQVARRCDQLAVMLYDTSVRSSKTYRHLMAGWTEQVLNWSEGTPILLGLPVYDDAGVGYHFPEVENLVNGLQGINAGLEGFATLPAHYQGVAIYCEWQMEQQEWLYLSEHFLQQPADPTKVPSRPVSMP